MTTPTRDLADLAMRLDKLERQNRWLLRALVLVVLVAGTGLLMGSQRPAAGKVGDLGNVMMRDDAGRACGWMRVTRDGMALMFADEEGRVYSGLDFGKDSIGLRFFHANGSPHSGLSVE